jgi:hypothetical protein
MATTFVRPLTRTGTLLCPSEPFPRFPNSSSPHAQTVPSDMSASAWSRAPAIWMTPVRFFTRTGTCRLAVVPSPSWPKWFQPQLHTVPFVLSAMLW